MTPSAARPAARRSSGRARSAAMALALVAAAAACLPAVVGAQSPAPSGGPDPSAIAAQCAALPAAAIVASPSPVAPTPSPTPRPSGVARGYAPDATIPPGVLQWPASIITATLALVSADGEIGKAASDWANGIQAKDMEQLLSGVQGLAQLADESLGFAGQLEIWPTLTEDARTLERAYCALSSAAHAFADAMIKGDAAGVESANSLLVVAMQQYGTLRPRLMDLGDLAILMQHHLDQ
ncbi:MAG: hypothetical protein U0869_09485 [Chloroflexota bacterium]